jgi:integrase
MAHMKELTTPSGTRWDVRWRLPNGSFRQKRFASKAEAKRWLASVTITPADTLAGRTTFAVVADQAIMAKPLKPSTLAGYVRIVRDRLNPTFGPMRVDKITRQHVVAWLAGITDVSASTKRSYAVTLHKVLRYAVQEGLITRNVMDGLMPPIKQRPDHAARFLSAGEVDKLALALVDAWPANVLVTFAAWSGLRAGELTALRISDVNLRRGIVSVTKTARKPSKTWEVTSPKSLRSNREVPLAPHVVALMRTYLTERPDQGKVDDASLWPGRRNGGDRHGEVDWAKPHEHTAFYRNYFTPATVACGLSPLRFHDLRHTFASLCAEAGVPIHKVSRWMGHANISTTDMIYTHLFADNSEELAKLSRLAGGS